MVDGLQGLQKVWKVELFDDFGWDDKYVDDDSSVFMHCWPQFAEGRFNSSISNEFIFHTELTRARTGPQRLLSQEAAYREAGDGLIRSHARGVAGVGVPVI